MTLFHVNGIDLEADAAGPADGIPLLMIHGFGQQSISWNDDWVGGFLRAGFKVITFDNRDTGLSQKWDGIQPDTSAISAMMRNGQTPDVP
jgi:pimeloyl-ACP methyl ester carboxylesterase